MATYADHYEAAKAMTRVQLESAIMRDKARISWGYTDRLMAYEDALRQKIAVEIAAAELHKGD